MSRLVSAEIWLAVCCTGFGLVRIQVGISPGIGMGGGSS